MGLWQPLEDLVRGSPSDYIRDREKPWLEDVVPQLGIVMGSVYRDAVRACIGEALVENETGMQPVELFGRVVVEELLRCYA